MLIAYCYLITLIIAPQLWTPPVIGLRIDYVVYPAWIIFLLVKGGFGKFKVGVQEKFFIFWIFWIFISQLANGVIGQEAAESNTLFYYIKYFLLYVLISCTIQSLHQLKSFIIFFVILSFTLAVEGIQHKYTGIGWAGQSLGWIDPAVLEAGGTGRTRWVGIFDGPGVFCVIYTLAMPFFLMGIKRPFGGMMRIFSFVSIPLMAVAIYFNGSRGGILTALVIILMHYGQDVKNAKLKLYLGITMVIGILMSLPAHILTMNDPSLSGQHRVEMWAEGVEMITQNPVFGIGKGQFVNYTSALIAHSSPIEIMGETGFIGFFAWIGFIYYGLKRLYYFLIESEDQRDKLIVKGLMISIIGYIVSSFFVTLEYETFYMLLALCLVVGREVEREVAFTLKDFRNIICMGITWVFVKIFCMMFF
jgi:O-antigen ligase